MQQVSLSEPAHSARVQRIADMHRKEAERLLEVAKSETIRKARELHEDPKRGVRHIGKKLNKQPAPPLRFVRRDNECSDGGVPGTITTDPVQVDGVITRA